MSLPGVGEVVYYLYQFKMRFCCYVCPLIRFLAKSVYHRRGQVSKTLNLEYSVIDG